MSTLICTARGLDREVVAMPFCSHECANLAGFEFDGVWDLGYEFDELCRTCGEFIPASETRRESLTIDICGDLVAFSTGDCAPCGGRESHLWHDAEYISNGGPDCHGYRPE